MGVLLSRWTSSGTAGGSVWNGSISSRVNARPIRTVLVRFHMEPYSCKRGLSGMTGVIMIILLQRCPCSNTLRKPNYMQLSIVRVKNKNADLTGSRSLRGIHYFSLLMKRFFRWLSNRPSEDSSLMFTDVLFQVLILAY